MSEHPAIRERRRQVARARFDRTLSLTPPHAKTKSSTVDSTNKESVPVRSRLEMVKTNGNVGLSDREEN